MDTLSLKLAVTMAFAEFSGEIRRSCTDEAQHIEALEVIQMLVTKHIEVLKQGKTPLDYVIDKMKTSSQADGAVDSISDTPL